MGSVHSQTDSRLRFEWGATGAATIVEGANLAVVIDVLSFTTTLSVAIELGAEVYPYEWRDDAVAEYAEARDATYAVGRFEARDSGPLVAVSLSPSSLQQATGLQRLVLPSPNGSTISAMLRDSGAVVVGACLRNRKAVAHWLADRMASDPGTVLAVIASGERWGDRTLRPCVEDMWGAGAVLDELVRVIPSLTAELSPEARMAMHSFQAVQHLMATTLLEVSSGRELIDVGFRDDVVVAAEIDASKVVPVLNGERFVDASPARRDHP